MTRTPGPEWYLDLMHRREPPAGFPEYLESLRALLDSAAEARPDVLAALTAEIQALTRHLQRYRVGEAHRLFGRLPDEPGRGSPVTVPYVIRLLTPERLVADVRFRPLHLGGNGAAHGGTVAHMFDEVMAEAANAGDRPLARTAFLTVNYRSITPVETDLHLEATLTGIDGRKRWMAGQLWHGDVLCADANGLWVELLDGQP